MKEVSKDGTGMTIGVDLGDKWSRLCVLDEHGEVCEEGRIATTTQAMRKRFSTEAPCRIVIEVGTHSPWVQRLLQELGHEVITAHTQSVRLIYGETNKNDRLDAERLAESVLGAIHGDPASCERNLPRRAARAMQMEAQLRQATLDSIRALVRAVEAKDPYTRRHSEQVACYATDLADYMDGLSASAESLRVASLLHDIGKIGVPDEVLLKPSKLTDSEFAHVKRHSGRGYSILEHFDQLSDVVPGILHHHERYDGRGYPEGLSSDGIPLCARIIAVADAYDAMTSDRSFRKKLTGAQALKELHKNLKKQFDAHVVAAAISALESEDLPLTELCTKP